MPVFRAAVLGLVCASLSGLAASPASAMDATSGNPSLTRMGTPTVTSMRPFTPLLPVGDGTDIAALATGAPVARPLVAQLQLLFEAFDAHAPQGSTQTVRLQVGYAYALAPGSALQVQIPIALVASATFAVPADWSPGTPCDAVPDHPAFVCRLAAAIRQWDTVHHPSTVDAELTFDLAATRDGATAAPVRASGLTLRLVDVTDL